MLLPEGLSISLGEIASEVMPKGHNLYGTLET